MSTNLSATSKCRISCAYCGKPLQLALSPGAKRYCSENCAAASLQFQTDSQQNIRNMQRKLQPSATITSGSSGNNDMLSYHDGDSSMSSTDDNPTSSASSNHAIETYKPPKKKKKNNEDGFDWTDKISDPEFFAASVIQVKHAPLARMWENISEGMKLEVENKDVDCRMSEPAFWVASVIRNHGYYVLLRYEGFGNDSSGDFWMHLCSETIHHVGWCANKGKPLIPPKTIAKKFSDWRNFLVHRLTGARTLPANFLSKLESGMKSVQSVGDLLEVVDKNEISQLKVATVTEVVGRRLHVKYWDNDHDGGFWCHEESRLIHPTGWAKTIGHRISCPPGYAPPPLPTTPYDADFENMDLQVGMKLEAIDPLNLSAICAATIKKVLRRGYVMVRIDCYEEDESGFDWFCYHISSNSVFPCGFCETNGIPLKAPKDWDKPEFTWDDYYRIHGGGPAPIKPKEKVLPHNFRDGMKIEAADLMDPRLICVATISKVVGRLLKIHFDGWDVEYDQWMDARSPDIYPIGWCELVKYRLEPPRPPAPIPKNVLAKKGKKGGKKKGGAKVPVPKAKGDMKTDGNEHDIPVNTVRQGPSKPSSTITSASAATTPGFPKVTYPQNAAPKTSNNLGNSFNGNTVAKNITMTPFNPVKNVPSNNSSQVKVSSNQDLDSEYQNSDPVDWSILDVAQYLTSNDCAAYCEFFTRNNVDGVKLLSLSKDELITLTGMKVGPAVKIYDLISQLKRTTNAAKAKSIVRPPLK